jgi:hypothetical protein
LPDFLPASRIFKPFFIGFSRANNRRKITPRMNTNKHEMDEVDGVDGMDGVDGNGC